MVVFIVHLLIALYDCWAERHGGIRELSAENSFLA